VRAGAARWLGALLLWPGGAFGAVPPVVAPTPAWEEHKSAHFLVQHRGDAAFAEEVARRAEGEYDRITRDLGFTRHSGFWLWERRVRIDIHATREEYRAATGAPAWSAGRANYVDRSIATFAGSSGFVKSVLPHEIAHLVFREFIGTDRPLPLWLDEGVAQWEDLSNRETVMAMARTLRQQDHLLTIPALTAIEIRHGSTVRQAASFYAQAASLVGFMIERHGSNRFREFCGHLRDGRTLEDALRFTYPHTIRNLETLERGWRAYLEGEPS
jgi:hypothetical protein